MGALPDPIDEMQAEIFRAMGHPTRVRIVKLLKGRERAVSEIVRAVGAEQSNVSRHLSILRQAGILSSRKEGLKVFYRVTSPELVAAVDGVFSCMQDLMRLRLRANESVLDEIADPPSPPAGGD